MTERVKVWQCVGCGRIDGPRPCVGICRDEKVEFVHASDYEEAEAKLERASRDARTLQAVLRRIVATTPRNGEWERSYRALQDEARRAIAAQGVDSIEGPELL